MFVYVLKSVNKIFFKDPGTVRKVAKWIITLKCTLVPSLLISQGGLAAPNLINFMLSSSEYYVVKSISKKRACWETNAITYGYRKRYWRFFKIIPSKTN